MSPFTNIPGATPITDVSHLKNKRITTRQELNAAEAENIRKATVKYLAAKPTRRSARFDFAWTLRLHREMFGDVWAWAGQLRTSDLNIGVPFAQVETDLFNLIENVRYREKLAGVDALTEAVTLHHEAVRIHPFLNGNGRWSRMLCNIWLKLHAHPLVFWPEEAVGEVSPVRDEYLTAIRAADERDLEPLLALHRRFLEPS